MIPGRHACPKARFLRRAKKQACLLVLAAALETGCGYIGGPQPPLANVPSPVRDLGAIQRGNKIIAQFTIPVETTEKMTIQEPLTLDLRIGTGVSPFTPEAWAAHATQVPPPAKAKGTAQYEIPSGPWTGKDVTVGVRAVGSNGKASDWSNFIVLPIVAPPDRPMDLHGESMATGIRLTWRALGNHFHVVRKNLADATAPPVVTDVLQPEYLDTTAAIGTEYSYTVLTFVPLGDNKEAQSDLSAELKITRQAPPPGTPTGLLAVPGPNTVELSWDSNPDAQTTGYRVYRAAPGADFVKIGEVAAVPTYSDQAIEHGKTYRYAVSAIDKDGHEGPRCTPITVAFP